MNATSTGAALRRRTRSVLATVALAAVAFATIAATSDSEQPEGSIGVRLLEVPADRADDPRATIAILDHVAPGGRFERRMEVVSTVAEDVTVDIYGGNGRINNGIFVPEEDDAPGIADWISVDESPVVVPANGTREVTVAVDVPNNAPDGEYYGFVWVEPPASEGQVAVGNRVGVRLYLSVGTGQEPPLDFAIGDVTAARDAEGVPVVTAVLRNSGGRALDITGELSLSEGPAGLDAGPFPFDGSISLLPGDVGEMTITLDPALPDGPWLATITASSGLLQRTAEATISFPSEAGAEAPPAGSDTIGGTDADGNDISEELRNQRRALLPIAAVLILLAIAALWLLTQWRRRDEEEQAARAQDAGASADEIVS